MEFDKNSRRKTMLNFVLMCKTYVLFSKLYKHIDEEYSFGFRGSRTYDDHLGPAFYVSIKDASIVSYIYGSIHEHPKSLEGLLTASHRISQFHDIDRKIYEF